MGKRLKEPDQRLKDCAELRRLLRASTDPKERREIRSVMKEIMAPAETLKIVWQNPRRGPSALDLWKRRFAAKLKAVMAEKGVTLHALIFKSALPPAYVTRVVHGRIYPSHKARAALARALRTTTRRLES